MLVENGTPLDTNSMSNELKVAIEAAKKGAKYALTFYGKELTVDKKDDNTVFTKVDKETEEVIKKTILNKFPDAKFVGEETGGIPNKGAFWTIDPIDATRHFIRNIPLWSVLVSLIADGRPIIGVSDAPCLNEVVYAEKGKGAFLNDKKITVSNIAKIKDSLLIVGALRFFKDKMPATLRLIEACASIRSYVSPYDFHLLASGRSEITLDVYGKIWDIAPFKVIVEEAGGRVTNWEGKPWAIDDRGCIATNGILHEEVIKILNKR